MRIGLAAALLFLVAGMAPATAGEVEDRPWRHELAAEEARLEALLAAGAAERHPEVAAAAVDQLDCWLVDQEESPPTYLVDDCRAGFLTALALLERLEAAERRWPLAAR